MIAATCHCGAIRIHVSRSPRTVTRCNCSICRRYAALWAYCAPTSVRIVAPRGGLEKYAWRRKVRMYFRCKRCGCVTHYKYRKRGRGYPVAVNARNFDPEVLAAARIRNLDGASTWTWEYAR
jgi:hypothetical protein